MYVSGISFLRFILTRLSCCFRGSQWGTSQPRLTERHLQHCPLDGWCPGTIPFSLGRPLGASSPNLDAFRPANLGEIFCGDKILSRRSTPEATFFVCRAWQTRGKSRHFRQVPDRGGHVVCRTCDRTPRIPRTRNVSIRSWATYFPVGFVAVRADEWIEGTVSWSRHSGPSTICSSDSTPHFSSIC